MAEITNMKRYEKNVQKLEVLSLQIIFAERYNNVKKLNKLQAKFDKLKGKQLKLGKPYYTELERP